MKLILQTNLFKKKHHIFLVVSDHDGLEAGDFEYIMT